MKQSNLVALTALVLSIGLQSCGSRAEPSQIENNGRTAVADRGAVLRIIENTPLSATGIKGLLQKIGRGTPADVADAAQGRISDNWQKVRVTVANLQNINSFGVTHDVHVLSAEAEIRKGSKKMLRLKEPTLITSSNSF